MAGRQDAVASGQNGGQPVSLGWRRPWEPGELAGDEMDFTLTDEQRQLQEQASDFATRKLAGIARELVGRRFDQRR
jgi:hypothetical protein